MKKYLILFIALPLLYCCSSDSISNNNKYLPGYNFTFEIDMALPSYTNLQYTANPIRITTQGIGINGIIVMNTGSGYTAFENSCPNQELSSCSVLTLNGINAKCPCDGVEYSLFTGQASTDVKYPLKSYRVQIISPTVIRVYN